MNESLYPERSLRVARQVLESFRGLSPAEAISRVQQEQPSVLVLLRAEVAMGHNRIGKNASLFNRRRRSIGVVGAAALVSIALILVLMLPRIAPSQPVTASQILYDVRAVATEPGSQKVYAFTVETTGPVLELEQDGTVSRDGANFSRSNIWYEGPDKRRIEIELVDRLGDTLLLTTVVWDGIDAWVATEVRDSPPTVRVYRQEDLLITLRSVGALAIPNPAVDNLNSLLAEVLDCYGGGIVLGDDVVVGRKAHVINLGRSSCPGTMDPLGAGGAADRVIWVDAETAFVLRDELHDGAGNVVTNSTRQVTSVEYNVQIPKERFTLAIPPGASVVDCRVQQCD
jgi:hypothetical protein